MISGVLESLRARLKPAALLRFAAGGLLSSGISVGSTALLHELGSIPPHVAAAVGLALAFAANFVVLRLFVFRGTKEPLLRQSLVFLGSSAVFRGLEWLGFYVLNVWLGVQYLAALIIVLGLSFMLKFFVYEGWVFRRKSAT